MDTNPGAIPAVIAAVKDVVSDEHTRTQRNIIVCLDGTGEQLDADVSNVVKFFAALKKDDHSQLCYYQSGVGTYSDGYRTRCAAMVDMAFGSTLGGHVRDAYSFLMQNYREGDKICLIGFSRGAYTARALAGMLCKVGLLPAHNQEQIAFAYRWYKDDSANGWNMSSDFKRTFSINVKVHFLGCWDTVSSVGFIPRTLPFTESTIRTVTFFRHAIALDERRAKFMVSQWQPHDSKQTGDKKEAIAKHHLSPIQSSKAEEEKQSPQKPRKQRTVEQESIDASQLKLGFFSETQAVISSEPEQIDKGTLLSSRKLLTFEEKSVKRLTYRPHQRSSSLPCETIYELVESPRVNAPVRRGTVVDVLWDRVYEDQANLEKKFLDTDASETGALPTETDVLEVWFLGCHSDCGGGAVPNDTRSMLSRIPLRWMIRETFACDTGILYHTDVLAQHGLDVDDLWPRLEQKHGPAMGPAPSVIDKFAGTELPSLQVRRNSIRRRSQQYSSKDTRPALPLLSSPSSTVPSMTTGTTDSDTAFPHSGSTELDILSERDEDYFDAMAPINDELKRSWGWWLLEILCPVKSRAKGSGKRGWKKLIFPNFSHYRTISDHEPNVHWTVLEREKHTKYRRRCVTDVEVQWKVVY